MTMIDPEPEAETSIQNASRKHVLVEAYCAVDGQRRADYGPALESFQRIADIASAGLAHKLTEPLEPEDICWLLLYALKGSRAAQGLRTGTYLLARANELKANAAFTDMVQLGQEIERGK